MDTNLINLVESRIRTKDFRNDYAIFGLVVLQEGGDDTRESEGTTVQRVAELGLAIGVTVAQMEPVGLEGLEVGN